MRVHYVWDRAENDWVVPKARTRQAPKLTVISDIDAYKSIITGETIGGRRQHRDHLRAHNCIEVGNERLETRHQEMPSVAQDLREARDTIRSHGLPLEVRTAMERARRI